MAMDHRMAMCLDMGREVGNIGLEELNEGINIIKIDQMGVIETKFPAKGGWWWGIVVVGGGLMNKWLGWWLLLLRKSVTTVLLTLVLVHKREGWLVVVMWEKELEKD